MVVVAVVKQLLPKLHLIQMVDQVVVDREVVPRVVVEVWVILVEHILHLPMVVQVAVVLVVLVLIHQEMPGPLVALEHKHQQRLEILLIM